MFDTEEYNLIAKVRTVGICNCEVEEVHFSMENIVSVFSGKLKTNDSFSAFSSKRELRSSVTKKACTSAQTI